MNVLVPPTSEAGITRSHVPAAGALADAELPAHQDGLLQAMLWICRHHGEERSAESLLAGLPRGSRLKPSVALRAMEEHGFSAGVVERHPAALSTYLFPAVLLMKEGGAVIVLRRIEPSRKGLMGRSGKDIGRQYEIVVPETGKGVTTVGEEVLLEDYSGHAMLIKPRPAADARSGEPLPEAPTRWLFGTLWRYRSYYYSTVLAAILINVLTLAGTFFTMNVYDRVVPNQAYTTLWSMAIGVVVAMVFEFIARHIRSHLLDQAGKKADLMLGAMLFRQALAIRLEHRPASAGSFAHQLREFESVRDFITSATLATLTDLPFVFLFIGVVYMIAGPLAWVPALAVPLVVGVCLLIQWPLSRVMRENLRESSMKQGILIEAVEGIESLKASGSEGFMQKRWEDCSALTAHTALKSRELSTTAMNFVQLVQQLETVVIMVWGVYLIGAGQLAQGALFGAVMLASRAVAPLGQVVGLAARFQQAKAALESLNRLMKMPTERDKRRVYLASPQVSGGIQAKEVSFAYPAPPMTPNPQVLNKVDVDIRAGERVAILGRIGSGKSTLLRVMAGLYQPVSGQVLADGVDISQIDPGDWRSSIGFVGQDVRLFYGSLRENVMMSRQSATTEQFLQVARMTGLDRLAAAHPLGFDLQVGEMGQALSGGQRQLVGLARCLLARPRVLLMDEPTSAMDGQTESLFMQQLVASLQGRTFVLVTHRLALLELVDRVIVIDGGRVMLDGPKAQVLAALGGVPQAPNT